MKSLITFLASSILILQITSCSSSQKSVNYSYKFISESKKDSYTEVYTYHYGENDEWSEIEIFVTNYPNHKIFVIDIGDFTSASFWTQQLSNYYSSNPKWPKNPNTFIYYDKYGPNNLHFTWDSTIIDTAKDLDEALLLSLHIYLQYYSKNLTVL